MMTSGGGHVVGAPNAAQMQLETLERLPCGCVVAIQTVRPSGVPLISLEAKGPHCTHMTHRANKVIRLGEPFDPLDYEDRGDLFI
jgi:hypothetical protein